MPRILRTLIEDLLYNHKKNSRITMHSDKLLRNNISRHSKVPIQAIPKQLPKAARTFHRICYLRVQDSQRIRSDQRQNPRNPTEP
ncbi:hypothetical protein WN55_03753 [Dufourea novaeangliae]|uniref:Uncharacterized protein n=1 Tax=Dufourea novaeangliae TaxID=178035 RepID=A0A154PK48_DUFNO|nr:hypothetical protein WN55_03753 [Dufourea novaeangliae]